MKTRWLPVSSLIVTILATVAVATDFKPITPAPGYDHDRWGPAQREVVREFRAYVSSMDSGDDDTGDGEPDYLRVPSWVAYELRAQPENLGSSPARPRPWITIDEPNDPADDDVYPDDDSYRNSGYHRGHLCMKHHAWRLGANADWNTHTTANAVPQEPQMNTGIWLRLEKMTGEWADTWGAVWIIAGPIFYPGQEIEYIGDPGEERVAIPHALFKIVIAETVDEDWPDVLAFLFPQHGVGDFSSSRNADVTPYLTSIDLIEALTGLDFLPDLDEASEQHIERIVHTNIDAWFTEE